MAPHLEHAEMVVSGVVHNDSVKEKKYDMSIEISITAAIAGR